MHRRQKSELLLVDTEIKRTLRNLKKVKVEKKKQLWQNKKGLISIYLQNPSSRKTSKTEDNGRFLEANP